MRNINLRIRYVYHLSIYIMYIIYITAPHGKYWQSHFRTASFEVQCQARLLKAEQSLHTLHHLPQVPGVSICPGAGTWVIVPFCPCLTSQGEPLASTSLPSLFPANCIISAFHLFCSVQRRSAVQSQMKCEESSFHLSCEWCLWEQGSCEQREFLQQLLERSQCATAYFVLYILSSETLQKSKTVCTKTSPEVRSVKSGANTAFAEASL